MSSVLTLPLHGLAGYLGLERRGPGLPLPEKAKPLPVPAKQRIRLNDEQRTLPRSQPARQQHQQGSVSTVQLRSMDLPVQNYELLAQ